MINDDVIAYANKAGCIVTQTNTMIALTADNFYFEVSGDDSVKSFEAFINTPGLALFMDDLDEARKHGFGVASVLQLLAKAKILFG